MNIFKSNVEPIRGPHPDFDVAPLDLSFPHQRLPYDGLKAEMSVQNLRRANPTYRQSRGQD